MLNHELGTEAEGTVASNGSGRKPTLELDAAPSFTPGPWMYRPNPGSTKENWTFHIDRQGTPGRMNWGVLIAACWGHVSESAEANARLIAAAPALYAALKAALPRVAHVAACASVPPTDEWSDKGSTTFDGCQCEIRTIVAALALADGQEASTAEPE